MYSSIAEPNGVGDMLMALGSDWSELYFLVIMSTGSKPAWLLMPCEEILPRLWDLLVWRGGSAILWLPPFLETVWRLMTELPNAELTRSQFYCLMSSWLLMAGCVTLWAYELRAGISKEVFLRYYEPMEFLCKILVGACFELIQSFYRTQFNLNNPNNELNRKWMALK